MKSIGLSAVLCLCIGVPAAWAAEGDGPVPVGLDDSWTTPRAVVPSTIPVGTARIMRNPPWAYRIDKAQFRPRGPSEVRDEWLLAQPRMMLPAVSPDPVPVGQWKLHLYVNRGSDFGWNQSGPAEMPIDRRFLVDGEHQNIQLTTRFGVMPKLNVGLKIPVYWRGGGFMDGIIDWFHELTEPIGFKDNGRPAFLKDEFRVEGRTPTFDPISWNDERGWGLGNIELDAHWNFLKPKCRSDWRASAIARLGLPTGTGPWDGGGVDLGMQLAFAKQIACRWDVYFGGGGTFFTDIMQDGLRYEPWRAMGFAAVEYHVSRRVSIIVSVDVASRMVTNLARYPGISAYIHAVTRWDISRLLEVEIGFTENLEDQQGTIDFGAFLGFTFRI